jgi:hypothetical protein
VSNKPFDPKEETAGFIRLMAQHGFEATVVWQRGNKGEVTSNAGKEGVMRAAARLTIKDGAIERAARALHGHMVDLPGDAPAPKWEELNQAERDAIRTMVKTVITAGLDKVAETPSGVVV